MAQNKSKLSGKNNGHNNFENDVQNKNQVSDEIVKDWNYFWRRVIKDITNKDLAPVKILFFFKYATLFVLYPFLTLHMAELGLDEWEIGINQATAPVIAILGPPFVGIVADKIGNFKILLSFMTLVNAGMALLLLFVPKARETVILPTFATFDLSCNNSVSDYFILQSIDDSVCTININETSHTWTNLPSVSLHCGKVCPLGPSSSPRKPYSKFEDFDFTQNITMELPDGRSFIDFFPGTQPNFSCKQNDSTPLGLCSINFTKQGHEADNKSISSSLEIINLSLSGEEFATVKKNVTELRLEIDSEVLLNGKNYDEVKCEGALNDGEMNGCTTKCLIQYDRSIFCSNKKERKIYNVGLTFGIYTLFRLLLGFASATSFVMFEGAVLAIMKQYGGDYGLQRVFATLAAIVVAPLSGTILKSFGFRPVICLYSALKAISAFVTLAIDLEFKKPAEKVIQNLREVLSKLEILIFFLAMLWSGTVWGYLETFLFLYLERMGGSRLLMGLTISVGGIAGLPLLIFSRPIIKRLGHVNCLCLGLLFYCFRYFGYSLITDPWQCLIFEAFEAVTVSLAITAASTYAVALSNLQTIASIQGIFGCLYFGIGRGAGSFIGGLLIKSFGHIQTFRVFGVGSLVGAVVYFLVNLVYLRKHSMAHTGLDINNLHLHSEHSSKDAGGKTKRESARKMDLETQKQKQNGTEFNNAAYVGPLAVNKFSDVPLDEDGQ